MNLKNIINKILDVDLFNTIKILFYIISKNYSKYPSYVENFEKLISKHFNSKYALTFSSGTAAFYASFLSLNLKERPDVLISRMTFPSVVTVLKILNANLTFFNIDKNFQPDIAKLKKKNFDLIIITHPFGFKTNFEVFEKYKGKKTKLIFDCSHAQGLKFKEKNLNEYADISFMSIQGNKAISGGEGGIIFTDNNKYYLNMINSHHPGHKLNNFKKFTGIISNLKLRMHPIASLLAISDLNNFDKKNKRLKEKFKLIYKKLINIGHIDIPDYNFENISGFHYGLPFYIKNEKQKTKWPIIKFNWPIEYDENLNILENLDKDNFLSRLYFIDLDWIKNNSNSYILNSIEKIFQNDL